MVSHDDKSESVWIQRINDTAWGIANRKGELLTETCVNSKKSKIDATPFQRDKIEYNLFEIKLLNVFLKSDTVLKTQHRTVSNGLAIH